MRQVPLLKLGIMQPYFFPYIGYWQLIKTVDKYIVYDDVNFIKNGWINRNYILLNNQKFMFTLPLMGASPFSKINEIYFTTNVAVKKKLLRALTAAYHKAPFFNKVYPMVEEIILIDSKLIIDLLALQFKLVCSYINIDTEFIFSSTIPNSHLTGIDRVIDICHIYNVDTYINAIGGTALYSKDYFKKQNINLHFLKSQQLPYKQFNNDFVPSLSFIDILMFNSPQAIYSMLDGYELV